MRTWRNDVVKRYGVSLPAHHPTVAWLVRHCAWLHDRFVMKRQDQQTPFQRQMVRDYPGVVIPIFETVLWREPGPHVLKFKEKWGYRHLGRTRQLGRYAHHFDKTRSLNRQISPQARAERGSRPAAFVGSQRTSREVEPEVSPSPPAQSLTPTRPPEPAAAQDTAAGPAPATPAGGAVESKHCEIEQSEEKIKTDTQMDDVRDTSASEAGETPDSTSPCSLFRRLYTPLRRGAQEGPTITSKPTRSRRRESS